MENEILNQILSELKELRQGQTEMRGDITDLKQGQAEMRGDITDLKQGQERLERRVDELSQGQAKLDKRVGELETQLKYVAEDVEVVRRSVVKIELEEIPKIHIALEGYAANYDKLIDHEKRITRLERKSG